MRNFIQRVFCLQQWIVLVSQSSDTKARATSRLRLLKETPARQYPKDQPRGTHFLGPKPRSATCAFMVCVAVRIIAGIAIAVGVLYSNGAHAAIHYHCFGTSDSGGTNNYPERPNGELLDTLAECKAKHDAWLPAGRECPANGVWSAPPESFSEVAGSWPPQWIVRSSCQYGSRVAYTLATQYTYSCPPALVEQNDICINPCESRPINRSGRKLSGGQWLWSETGDLDDQPPHCNEVVTCPCGKELDVETGECKVSAPKPTARNIGNRYQWRWSEFDEFELPGCYSDHSCDCGQTFNAQEGKCKTQPPSPELRLQTLRKGRWSNWSDFEVALCSSPVDCDCGTRPDLESGECLKIPGLTGPKSVEISQDVNLFRKRVTYHVSETGDMDEGCYIKMTDDSGNCCSSSGVPQASTANGVPLCKSNPIHCGSGSKTQTEPLFSNLGPAGMGLTLHYRSHNADSQPLSSGDLGSIGGWQLSGLASLKTLGSEQLVAVEHAGRSQFIYSLQNGVYGSSNQGKGQLSRVPGGWQLMTADGSLLDFDTGGLIYRRREALGRDWSYEYETGFNGQLRLARILGKFQQSIGFVYDGSDRLQRILAPDAQGYGLRYHPNGALAAVSMPGRGERSYSYQDSAYPYALTSISESNGTVYANFGYDARGLAVFTEHADGAQRVSVEYPSASQARVTTQVNPFSATTRLYSLEMIAGLLRVTQVEWQPCPGCATATEQYRFDDRGYLAEKRDATGSVTLYLNDERGRLLQQIDAYGTPQQRSTTTAWHARYALPLESQAAGLTTRYQYDDEGRTLSEARTDGGSGETRVIHFSYNADGLLTGVDGPREEVGDVTQYLYSQTGLLQEVVNALGQRTLLSSWDAAGRPQRIQDPNGVVTNRAYDAAGRMVSREQDGAVWSYHHDDAGRLTQVTSPTQGQTLMRYNAAGMLIATSNGQGEWRYARDALGNAVETTAYTAANEMLRRETQEYDPLGRLVARHAGGDTAAETYDYDLNDRLIRQTDALGHSTRYAYDPLGRLASFIDPLGSETRYGYDAASRLNTVTDARGLNTRYTHNAFGEVTEQTSPDTGKTTFVYDKGGNLVRKQDARGVVMLNSYDALNRLTSTRYEGNDGTLQSLGIGNDGSLNYHYDGSNDAGAANGIGRLTGISGNGNQIIYRYDARGNQTEDIRVLGTTTQRTGYAYDAADRVIGITYPGGRVVRYARDAAGQTTAVTTQASGGLTTRVATDIQYEPIPGGKLVRYVAGDDAVAETADLRVNTNLTVLRSEQRQYDLHGRLAQQISPDTALGGALGASFGLKRQYSYNARGDLTGIQDNSAAIYIQTTAPTQGLQGTNIKGVYRDPRSYAYQYDAIGRLSQASGHWGQLRYHYDAVGNRTTQAFNPAIAGVGSTNTTSPTSPAHPPIPTNTAYQYAADSQRLLSAVGTGGNASSRSYVYGASGNPTTAGSLTLTYDASDRAEIIANTAAGNAATVLQHYAPEGWRDQKLGNGHLARFAYDRNGRLLEEANLAATTAMQAADPFVTQGLNTFNQSVVRALPEIVSPLVQSLPLLTPEIQADLNSLVAYAVGIAAPFSETVQADLRYKLYPARKEMIWLDDLPLAVIQSRKAGGPSEIFFIHSDHLNQPQRITDTAGLVAWERSQLPFGEDWQDPQPAVELSQPGVITQAAYLANQALFTGTAIDFNLRFPGQYADPETQLNQNWFRDYDPTTGRYIQSDLIGLAAGINTYAYVEGNPVSFTDPHGLFVYDVHYQLTMNATGDMALAKAVADVDFLPGSQDPGLAHWHAMRPPWRSPEDGEDWFRWYVDRELSKCSRSGLARALHAMQDSASAAHKGSQVWDGGSAFHFPGWSHIWNDAWPTMNEWNDAGQKTRRALEDFAKKCECSKITD